METDTRMDPLEAVAVLRRPLDDWLRTPQERVATARVVAEAAAVLLDVIGPACFRVAESLEQDLPRDDAETERMLAGGETPAWRLSYDLASVAGALCGTDGDPYPRNLERWQEGICKLLEAATWPQRGPAAGVSVGSA